MNIFSNSLMRCLCEISILVSLATSCSNNGHSPSSDAPVGKPNLPLDEDAIEFQKVSQIILNEPAIEEFRCEQTQPPAYASSTVELNLDGNLDEWADIEPHSVGVRFDAAQTFLKVLDDDAGIYLGIKGLNPDENWELRFVPYALSSGEVQLEQAQSILFKSDGDIVIQDGTVSNSNLVLGQRTSDTGELFVSNYILDRVRFYPLWQIQLRSYGETSSYLFRPISRPSYYLGNSQLSQKYCAFNEVLSSLNWFVQEPLEEVFQAELENILSAALMELSESFQGQYNLSLLVGNQSDLNWLGRDMLSIWINQNTLSQSDKVTGRNQVIRDMLDQVFHHWLVQLVPVTSKSSVKVISKSLSRSFAKKHLGDLFFYRSMDLRPEVQVETNLDNLSFLLSTVFTFDQILGSTKTCIQETEEYDSCILNSLFAETSEPISADNFLNLWIAGGDLPISLDDIVDTDGDGLPNIVEKTENMSEISMDTDSDGWSDLSEYLLGTDSKNPIAHPEGIVLDGLFSEWFDLIPGRISVDDRKEGSQCEKVDIAFYAAIQKGDRVIIGASLEKFDQGSSVEWQISVDSKDAKTVGMKVLSGTKEVVFIEDGSKITKPFVMGRGEIEVDLPYQSPNPINIQLSVSKDGKFCDDTPWFQPTPG